MNLWKRCAVVLMGASLVACSTDGQNTFMAYQDLQDMVRDHDAKWQQVAPKLERLEALEAELAELKSQQGTSLQTSHDTATTPIVSEVKFAPSVPEPVLVEAPAPVIAAPVVSPVDEADPALMSARHTALDNSQNSARIVPKAPQTAPQKPVYGVQLASYRTKQEATRGWRIVSQEAPQDYVDLAPRVNTKTINGRVMNQLKVGPFESKPFATDFCNMLKQQQKDCLVTLYDGEPISSY